LGQPHLYAEVHNDIREALVDRFPYAVYYRVEPAQVVVVAIVHTARDPAIWQSRN
jgi:plasmid stabilization system protein ParE